MQQMYPGKTNSPSSTLSSAYTAGDDHIHVSELSYFPVAPNIAVIGSGTDAVTYLYTGKSATSGSGTLTGVSDIEGTDKNWVAGIIIARNFTCWDHDIFVDNLTLLPAGLYRQAIINGNFDIWQRGTSFDSTTTPANNDDTYLADRWILLSDGNDVVDVSQATDIPDASTYSLKAQVETANKKFGFLTILENKNALKLDNKDVSLSFQAKTTTSKVIENLRAAVLSWSGTADTVTSDVVSAWGAEGADPTWATNWTAENTPANIPITTSWATYKVEHIPVDTASMANIAVLIWVDDTDAAVDDELFLAQVQLNIGEIALDFSPQPVAMELLQCLRYYEQWTPGVQFNSVAGGWNDTITYGYYPYTFRSEKRTTPSITVNDGTQFQVRPAGGTSVACTGVTFVNTNPTSTLIKGTVASGLTAGATSYLRNGATTAAYVYIDAEM